MIRLGIWLVVLLAGGTAFSAEKTDFAHDILPILRARCAECHTNGTYKGKVSFDTRAAALKAKAKIIARVTSSDPDLRMPPKGKALSAKQIAALRKWIDEDLPWQEGFSFAKSSYSAPLKLKRVVVPQAPKELKNPIDRLIHAYWSRRKITPPKSISDAEFLRRVSLDITGLLPTEAEIDSFLKDTSAEKRASVVRKLLANRRAYAEHWLTFWNDLLRNDYRGTGYIDGGRRQITGWLYRSLYDNKRYDRFVRELISPSRDSEGFIRGIKWRGRVNASQVRELQFAQNVSQVFLGINLKCASCHDSFINEWKLKDAYSMAAIVADKPLEMHRCDKPIGKKATPGFLYPELGKVDPKLAKAARLKQLSVIITQPANGRFTRTIVNRVWERLMGRGIVHPVDVMGNAPWDADLLDYLARHLIENKYDLKKTIELIVTSRAYQSRGTSQPPEETESRFVFRGPIARRLSAEQFMDAVWRITGTAPARPVANVGNRLGEPVRASLMAADALMRSLGRPNREQVVTTRPAELSTLTALDLSNGAILTNLLDRGANNLLKKFPRESPTQLTTRLYRQALSRSPTAAEIKVATQLLGTPTTEAGLSDLLWSIFMLPEFQLIR